MKYNNENKSNYDRMIDKTGSAIDEIKKIITDLSTTLDNLNQLRDQVTTVIDQVSNFCKETKDEIEKRINNNKNKQTKYLNDKN